MNKKQSKTDALFSEIDRGFMNEALALAGKGQGFVSPNPLVGCVIVDKNGQKIAEGYHEKYGKAHAEINALKRIKDPLSIAGATVYVTLEPCAHFGKTPPCAKTLANMPISRVVVATEDPNPKVNGAGISMLRAAGKQVDVGLLKEEAETQNEVFFHVQRTHSPLIILKMAQTLDGYMAAADGDSQWISSEQSRKLVHKWRATFDAVMVGRNTALVDNPKLTVRNVKGRQPKRIVLDTDLELPTTLNLFSDEFEEKTIRISANKAAFNELADPMLEILTPNYFRGQTLLAEEKDGYINLEYAFRMLLREGIQSILVEAGPTLAKVLFEQELVDKLALFIAPKILGNGQRSIQGLPIHRMSEITQFRKSKWTAVGPDMLFEGWF
jgi:diaminohydroxyphosphoribosylaminopyrimidine deaminase/5-amino-6-(5-phosphoribosylamino)uracil reductase